MILLYCDTYSNSGELPIYIPADMLTITITELLYLHSPIYWCYSSVNTEKMESKRHRTIGKDPILLICGPFERSLSDPKGAVWIYEHWFCCWEKYLVNWDRNRYIYIYIQQYACKDSFIPILLSWPFERCRGIFWERLSVKTWYYSHDVYLHQILN